MATAAASAEHEGDDDAAAVAPGVAAGVVAAFDVDAVAAVLDAVAVVCGGDAAVALGDLLFPLSLCLMWNDHSLLQILNQDLKDNDQLCDVL